MAKNLQAQVTTIQDLVGKTDLINWNGYNNSTYATSNRLLKAYHEKNENSFITSPTLKQIYKYHSREFDTIIRNGIQVNYQNYMITLKKEVKRIQVQAYNIKKEVFEPKVNLTQSSLKKLILDIKPNKDLIDVLQALVEKIS